MTKNPVPLFAVPPERTTPMLLIAPFQYIFRPEVAVICVLERRTSTAEAAANEKVSPALQLRAVLPTATWSGLTRPWNMQFPVLPTMVPQLSNEMMLLEPEIDNATMLRPAEVILDDVAEMTTLLPVAADRMFAADAVFATSVADVAVRVTDVTALPR